MRGGGYVLRLAHLHVSNDAAIIDEDETFPLRASRNTYLQLQHKLRQCIQYCTLYAADGTCHNIDKNEIVYLEGDSEYVLAHCKKRTVRVHRPLRELCEQQLPFLICVHRSFFVNPRHIETLRPYQVTLSTGENLPVSRKRYTAVCTKLAGGTEKTAPELPEPPNEAQNEAPNDEEPAQRGGAADEP